MRWGGLVTGLWPLLLLLCVGLLWGLSCAVMSPWLMVAPSPVVSRLGFLPLAFVRTWVGWLAAVLPGFLPSFEGGGGGTLLPLSWLFLLGGSYSLVVQVP